MGQSLDLEDVVALGEQILTELGASTTNNTLTRWLAHHTARLIQTAGAAVESEAPDAEARVAEARVAVLDLWASRSAWPNGWPPSSAATTAGLLESLPEWGDLGLGLNLLGRLHFLHHQVITAIVAIAGISDDTGVEERWLATFSEQLSAEEVTMLKLAVHSGERLRLLRDSPESDADNAGFLVELADQYRESVVGLFPEDPPRKSPSSDSTPEPVAPVPE